MDCEDELLRSAALQNSRTILAARERAERELLQAKEELSETAERLQDVLESMADGLLLLDFDWRVVYLNRRAEAMLGALVGRNFWQAFPELVESPLQRAFLTSMLERQTHQLDYQLGRWMEIRCHPVKMGLSVYFQDISRRKASEDALRQSENRFRSLVMASAQIVWTRGPNGYTVEDSPTWRHFTGQTQNEWQGLGWMQALHPDDRDRMGLLWAECTRSREGFETEYRLRRADGLYRWMNVRAVPVGGVNEWVGMNVDITEARQARQELLALADSIPQLAFMARPDGQVFWYNQRWFDYTGTTLEQVEGWGWQALHDPEMLPAVLEKWRACLATSQQFEMEYALRGADGVYRWFLTRVVAVKDSQGQAVCWFGTCTDIDEVKRIRIALQEETRLLELLNETGPSIAAELDVSALMQRVTDTATELTGAQFGAFFSKQGDTYALSNLSGQSDQSLPSTVAEVLPELPALSSLNIPVKSRSGETVGRLVFGHSHSFNARHERILVGIAAQAAIALDNARLYEDIQKAAVLREELLDAERAARSHAERVSLLKDEFLATLSHELRTPMNSILGWTQMLRSGNVDAEDTQTALETIERNARVQAQLIEDLLDMSSIISGKVRLNLQSGDLARVLEATLESARPTALAKGVTLLLHADGRPVMFYGDCSRLQQVFWNLLSNAIKFTPSEGLVEVLLNDLGDSVEVLVRDTGIGIQPEFLAHVFERFRQADSTTTRRFGGLGLGLSIVKNLVELHGGKVTVESAGEGQGTTFGVVLPTRAPVTPDPDSTEIDSPLLMPTLPLASADLSGLCIVVVDDEADGRGLVCRIVRDCQGEVHPAGSAREVLELLEHLRPDVLISDISMPEMDGYELIGRVREKGFVQLRAIALTAFAREEDRTRALCAGFDEHVRKPVEATDLISTIATLCARSPVKG